MEEETRPGTEDKTGLISWRTSGSNQEKTKHFLYCFNSSFDTCIQQILEAASTSRPGGTLEVKTDKLLGLMELMSMLVVVLGSWGMLKKNAADT